MNIVGRVAVAIFATGWLGGVVTWFVGAYHMVMMQVRTWQAKPPRLDQVLSNMFSFMRGPKAFWATWRSAWDGIPGSAKEHRRKMLRGFAAFAGFWAFAMAAALIGLIWGGWESGVGH